MNEVLSRRAGRRSSFSDFLYRLNRRYYSDPAVVADYASITSLLDAERAILERLDGRIQNRSILDLGVGAGRTTPHLRSLAGRYLALDYSTSMLAHCRRIHRDAALVLGDARRLALADESFDVAIYAWNGIDEVDHEDRLRILSEIRRVLRPGGTFVFSTHNLSSERISAFAWLRPELAGSVAARIRGNAAAIALYLRGIAHRLWMRRWEVHAPTHSIVNDHARHFSLLTYYISKEQQLRQLTEAGFRDVEMVRPDGSSLDLDEESRDPWIYYVARRPGGKTTAAAAADESGAAFGQTGT